MAGAPQIAFSVHSVEGRVVPRYGTDELIGAERSYDKRGRATITWQPERVIPLTEDYVAHYQRELLHHLEHGDLVKVVAAPQEETK